MNNNEQAAFSAIPPEQMYSDVNDVQVQVQGQGQDVQDVQVQETKDIQIQVQETKEDREIEKKGDTHSKHLWGEDEDEVGLHLTESIDPGLYLSPDNRYASPAVAEREISSKYGIAGIGTVIGSSGGDNLQQHIRELEQDLMEALSQLDSNVHALEEKDIQIDILENKIKQLHIDVS